ncbi:Crp/Fnr family transcriptional regulator [Aquimarina aggregata]|uniref:Crp/Fnr family transcriptional regulator n=1 Tax=Aquimarina aggregata TaxID=1642818 RepID=UPI002490E92B|nr:cyclic nucleotide-binding domain-containing protein [Aquimarina aggregata]
MKDFLSKIYKVNDDILTEYLSYWEEYIVPRKTVMTSPGKTQRHLYYVLEGIQKSYYLNEDKQHIILFTYAPSFSGNPGSFVTQTPSKYFLETITESKFLRISYEKHQQLMDQYREIETLFRKAIEYLLIGVMEKHYELMAFDIETRFKIFTKRSPHLLTLISQKDLASYLRIDSTNFSKLMNNTRI